LNRLSNIQKNSNANEEINEAKPVQRRCAVNIGVIGGYMCKERSSTNLRHSPAFPAIKQALLPLFQNRT